MRKHLRKDLLKDIELPPGKLAVIRPDDPKKAMARAEEIMGKEARGEISSDEARDLFQDIPTEQPYKFVGFLSGKNVVDKDGKIVGKLEPGDSFVNPESLSKRPPPN